jgi:hypothetical protein
VNDFKIRFFGLIGGHPAFRQQTFDVAEAQREPNIELDRVLVDFGQAIAEPSSVPQRITVGSRLGYARVSTDGQTLEAQLD